MNAVAFAVTARTSGCQTMMVQYGTHMWAYTVSEWGSCNTGAQSQCVSVQQLRNCNGEGTASRPARTSAAGHPLALHVCCVYLLYPAPLLSGGADARISLAVPYCCMLLWPFVLVWGAAVPNLGPCVTKWYAGRGSPFFAPLLCPPSLCSYTVLCSECIHRAPSCFDPSGAAFARLCQA